MEQEEFHQLPAAPFPAPPPFWKHFTKSNLEQLAAYNADIPDKNGTLPLELVYLQPPPPPPSSAETYTTFSIPQALNPTPAPPPLDILLFDSKSPTFSPATLLSRLTKSVLLNFLELTSLLGLDPMQYEEKMGDINRIMLNIHFAINLYRPHQAREGVKEMLEARLEDGRREIERCEEVKRKVEGFLEMLEGQRQKEREGEKMNAEGMNGVRSAEEEEIMNVWGMINGIEDE